MDYNLIIENIENIIETCARSIEIITDDEVNKDYKLQLKVNDMMKLLGDITGKINKNSIENYYQEKRK